jgi:homoserine/homoserine lactone efflux protein
MSTWIGIKPTGNCKNTREGRGVCFSKGLRYIRAEGIKPTQLTNIIDMSLESLITYVATVFIFLLSPGPSHLLMLSTSISYGFNKSWATGAGDLSAHLWQITVASIGLVSFIYTFQNFFVIIKWAGVAFLIYLGIVQFRKKNTSINRSKGNGQSIMSFFWRGFVTSSANPKAVVFFAALFPQFINTSEPTAHQFAILGLTYIVIDGCFLMFYGYFADWLSSRFEKHIDKYLNKISGSLLVGSAILLGLKDIKDIR